MQRRVMEERQDKAMNYR